MKRLEGADVDRRNGESHLTGMDRADLLTRDVPDLPWLCRLDGKSVEDVRLLIALDLRNRADSDGIRRDDIPSLCNLKPRNRVGH